MDQVDLPDPIEEDMDQIKKCNIELTKRIIELENELRDCQCRESHIKEELGRIENSEDTH